MDKDDDPALVQRVKQRSELLITKIPVSVVRHEHDAVTLEPFHGVRELRDAGLDVRKRQGGKEAEARRMVGAHLGGKLVAGSRQALRERDVIEP